MQIQSPQVITNLTVSGSFNLTPDATGSLVTQLSQSLNSLYIPSGSITQADWNTLVNRPAGIISGSSQLNNSTLSGMIITGSFSGSYNGDGSQLTGIQSGLDELQVVLLSQFFG